MAHARVLVTRPVRDALAWTAQLQQRGMQAEALALIDIAPLAAPANVLALAQAWRDIEQYRACMFVSGHAVDYFFKSNKAFDQQIRARAAIENIASAATAPTSATASLPAGLRFMAPGPGTAAALLAQGIAPGQIDAPLPDAPQFDSESLWQVIGERDWRGQRVLVLRGQSAETGSGSIESSGREWLAQQWKAAGAQVEFLAVYQRRAPVLNVAQLQRAQAASDDGSIWLFSSSEAVANLAAAPSLAALDWSRARAVVTHPRIGEAVQALGWGVVVSSRPALADVCSAIGSIESSYS